MAVGDVVSGMYTSNPIGQDARYDIRPPVGEEWVIRNITAYTTYEGGNTGFNWGITKQISNIDVTVSPNILLNTASPMYSLTGLNIHVTNTQWLQMYQVSPSGTVVMGFDGIRTK